MKNQLNNVQNLYVNHLELCLKSVLFRMVKPYEVRLVEDDNGNVVWIEDNNTEQSELHILLAMYLYKLSIMFQGQLKEITKEELERQLNLNPEMLNRDRLYRLCWSIGCLSDILNVNDERAIVISVIKDLLTLCEKKVGKDNKACVASNIMYVVGQYPRFLKNHFKFLKTVIKKLFEFLLEIHPGVQDMASETLLKILVKTKEEFVYNFKQNDNFIEGCCKNLNDNMHRISFNNLLFLYQGFGELLNVFTKELLNKLKSDRNFIYTDQFESNVIQYQNYMINQFMK